MRKPLLGCAILSVFFLISGFNIINSKENDYRVMIGLRWDSNKGSIYQTLWVDPNHRSFNMSKENELFIPYKDQIYLVKQESIQYKDSEPDWKINNLKIVPISKFGRANSNVTIMKNADSIKQGSVYEISRDSKIVFLNKKYMCIQGNSWYGIRGQMAGGLYSGKSFIHMFSLKDNRKTSLKEIYGEKGLSIVKKLQAQKITEKDMIDGNQELSTEDVSITAGKNITDEYNWGLIRKKGKWVAELAKVWEEQYENMPLVKFSMYSVLPELPVKIVRHNVVSPNWNQIKASIPNTIDAISSPDKSLLIVIVPEKIMIFFRPDQKLKNPDGVIAKCRNYTVIMSELITKDISIWDKFIARNSF